MAEETMTANDAYIAYRALCGIRRVADRNENYDIKVTMAMYGIVGKLEFHIFGFDSFNWREA